MSSPVNLILLIVFLAFLVIAFALRHKVGFFGWLGSPSAAVPSIACTLLMTIVMGLTAQIPERGWLGNMITFWPFVLCYVWLTTVVGLVAINHLLRVCHSWKEIPALLNHLGLFVTLVCATLGSVDKQTLEMTLNEGGVETVGVSEDGRKVETGLSVQLNDTGVFGPVLTSATASRVIGIPPGDALTTAFFSSSISDVESTPRTMYSLPYSYRVPPAAFWFMPLTA